MIYPYFSTNDGTLRPQYIIKQISFTTILHCALNENPEQHKTIFTSENKTPFLNTHKVQLQVFL